jgi:hypothetical protein
MGKRGRLQLPLDLLSSRRIELLSDLVEQSHVSRLFLLRKLAARCGALD